MKIIASLEPKDDYLVVPVIYYLIYIWNLPYKEELHFVYFWRDGPCKRKF